MRHQRQGTWECYPTTIAMLADVPKDEVMERVERALGMTYPQAIQRGEMSYPYRQEFCHIVTRVAASFGVNVPALWPDEFFPHGAQGIPDKLPGRGALVITLEESGVSHIVAYEDDVIFDPDLPRPQHVTVWKEMREHWKMRELHKEGN